jgi:hypothetical protein
MPTNRYRRICLEIFEAITAFTSADHPHRSVGHWVTPC